MVIIIISHFFLFVQYFLNICMRKAVMFVIAY